MFSLLVGTGHNFPHHRSPVRSLSLLFTLTSPPVTSTSLPYLLRLFPQVKEATITSVVQHELPPSDLYKLDSRYLDEGKKKTSELPFEFPNINSSLKEYETLSSIFVPLSTYFSNLVVCYQFAGNSALLAVQLFRYNAHLAEIPSVYACHLVVPYHMA
ncbi:hypothetical protein EDD85DRAFT_859736 [Armillaria nabsnona]|nr:hypothetical protein EDD85DRAFT_859736 [Armillaria nabsnona]